jgi:hypothetical protein
MRLGFANASMKYVLFVILAWASNNSVNAQDTFMRHKLVFDGLGVFPISGYKADEYSPGPGIRAGYEFRLHKYIATDLGWTAAWLPGTSCSRNGCTYPRYQNQLIDYGLRGVLPLSQRVELSLGIGGGYIWFDKASGDSPYSNSSLLQSSAKITVAIDRSRHFSMSLGIRALRDVGRPTQQWLSTGAGISYNFGRVQ